ncbi:MAG: hypothetical protein KY476_16910 [Planctomycetes bacterium]|nr:hypothetical protein [Planctomycetota bacterium]
MSLRNSMSVLAVALVAAVGLMAHAAGNLHQPRSEHGAGVADAPPAADPRIRRALAELPPQDRALAEQQRVCPVSGDALGSMGKPIKLDVEGRDVFVCCEGCVDTLRQNPAKYLAKLERTHPENEPPPVPAPPTSDGANRTYTCPMHPQIQWPRPDECPLCGMRLVLRGADRQGMPGAPPAHGRMPRGARGGVGGEQGFMGRNDFLPYGPPARRGLQGGCPFCDMGDHGVGGYPCGRDRGMGGPGPAADCFGGRFGGRFGGGFGGGFDGRWEGFSGCGRGCR